MASKVRPADPPGDRRRRSVDWAAGPGPCLLVHMQGILVVLVPVLIAGFALLMDRFENAILAQPERIDADSDVNED